MPMPVQISNLNEDEIVSAKVKQKLSAFVSKIEQIAPDAIDLHINFEKHSETGKKHKHTIKAKLDTTKGTFLAHKWGWNLLEVVEDATTTLEKEMKKVFDKERDINREKQRKMRGK
jgi:ribosome-associated translation inhibitor RaiA